MEKANAAKVNKPHDKGYKKDLSIPSEFLHFLQKYVGDDWTKELTVDQLELCDKEFIERDYEGREADLLYCLHRKNNTEVYIYILQELQSYVDYTMIFRVLLYVVDALMKHFDAVDAKTRESAEFRLPAIIPVVFYNGKSRWTAVTNMKEYQIDGGIFGDHVLNLQYYLIDLSEIDEEILLNTNTVIDNMMYCDKSRREMKITSALQTAYQRVNELSSQEIESFDNWVRYILQCISEDGDMLTEDFLNWLKEGAEKTMLDKSFKPGILQEYYEAKENARIAGHEAGLAEGKAAGLAEGHEAGLAEGKAAGLEEGIRVLIEACSELGATQSGTLDKLTDKYSLSEEEAKAYLEKYWK